MINPLNNNVSKINLPSSVSFKGQNLQFPVSDKSSFDDKKVSDAMSVSGRSIVKKDFSPAKTVEELSLQISEIPWLSEEDKCFDVRNLFRINKKEIPILSEFFHKADKLSPNLQKKSVLML